MHSYDLIITLTGGLTAALIFGYITQRLGLSPIVGYLIAGTLVGPQTPGLVVNSSLAEQMAEIGVILLMFGVGLQFHVHELLAVRRVAVPGALAASSVATALGALLAVAAGFSRPSAIIYGAALAVASTVVLIRVLSDRNELHTPTGHIAVGWLVVEDMLTVLAMVLLPAFFGPESQSTSVWRAVGVAFLEVGGLIAFTVVVGTRLIPRLLDHAETTKSRELFSLTVLVIALGIAVGSAQLFHVSMALGAFLAGMVVGRSDYSLRAATEALPLRDAFAVLFFVSVGMLLDPWSLMDTPWFFAGSLAIVLVGKPLVAMTVIWVMRYPLKTALAVALSLTQIGEFSFILSTMGRDLGLFSPQATNILVATAMVSIVLNPLMSRATAPIERWVKTRPRLFRLLNRPVTTLPAQTAGATAARNQNPTHRAIVIGYGPTGRTVARMLRENGIEPTILEMNVDTVRQLRDQGVDAVYGDATLTDTMVAAGAATAGSLMLTSAGMANSTEVIRVARALNPRIRVLARAAYLRDLPPLKRAGADAVYSGEGEVALSFVEDILEELGATPDQIDRERERAHRELAADGGV